MEKMTRVEAFNAIKAIVAESAQAEVLTPYIDKYIETLSRPSKYKGSGTSKAATANRELFGEVMLTTEGQTISELMAQSEVLGAMSTQKVTAILKRMVEDGKAVKERVGKKTLFSLPQ